jgi:hypothetical protein
MIADLLQRRSHGGLLPRSAVDTAHRRLRGRNGTSVTIINAPGSEDGIALDGTRIRILDPERLQTLAG